ncbi:MAG: glycosyl transferase [Sphingobacteriales bacterium]|nr:MAG: glycosyl transferase [Sphingobacteriales bacterium]
MKILYAIQGTGNGHLSRARDIYPELKKHGDVDIVISGHQVDMNLPFPVKYRLKGLSFIFGKTGGVSFWQTIRRMHPMELFRDIYSLPVEEYDLVVNDFEPVSAWACKLKKVPCIALSHQAAVAQDIAPKPSCKGVIGRFVLKYYAPYDNQYGFHFKRYADNIYPPVIRREVQALEPVHGKHYTVYLPSYSDAELIRFLHPFRGVEWQVFSKHNKEAFTFENISVSPVQNEDFMNSLSTCAGALLGAGFEGPAEALYLQKKLMVVPMKRQYEQQCNAAALEALGIPVIPALSLKHFRTVNRWINSRTRVEIQFPKETASIAISRLIEDFINKTAQTMNRSMPEFY